jgi:hypothetical protein
MPLSFMVQNKKESGHCLLTNTGHTTAECTRVQNLGHYTSCDISRRLTQLKPVGQLSVRECAQGVRQRTSKLQNRGLPLSRHPRYCESRLKTVSRRIDDYLRYSMPLEARWIRLGRYHCEQLKSTVVIFDGIEGNNALRTEHFLGIAPLMCIMRKR